MGASSAAAHQGEPAARPQYQECGGLVPLSAVATPSFKVVSDVHTSGGAVMRLSLVPQERRFYTLFKRQGELVNESLEQLRNGMLEGQTRHPRLRELEHECDDITHEIYNLINHTFVTPFEREDIYELASSLNDVVKWKDLYDLLETTMDQCEHVANVLEATSIKNA